MTIDEKVVAEVGTVFDLRWIGSGPLAYLVNRHGVKVGDKLVPLKAYAELAAERDKLAALRKHHRARAKSYKRRATDAESQLAELREKVVGLAEHYDWLFQTEQDDEISGRHIADELRALAAADGATTGEMKCPTP